MNEKKVKHSTVVVERRFKSAPTRVFAAWADPKAHGSWNVPGKDWVMAEYVSDFRVGGRQMSSFGPKGNPQHKSEGYYLDIIPDERIVTAGAMYAGSTRTSTTLCTVELLAIATGTHLILTDQSAYCIGETPEDRHSGWGQIIDRLEAQLKREEGAV